MQPSLLHCLSLSLNVLLSPVDDGHILTLKGSATLDIIKNKGAFYDEVVKFTLWQVSEGTSFRALSDNTHPQPRRKVNLQGGEKCETTLYHTPPTLFLAPVSSTHLQPSDWADILSSLNIVIAICLITWFVAWVDGQLELNNILQVSDVAGHLWNVGLVQESHQNTLLVVQPRDKVAICIIKINIKVKFKLFSFFKVTSPSQVTSHNRLFEFLRAEGTVSPLRC